MPARIYFDTDPKVLLIVKEHRKRPIKQQIPSILPNVTLTDKALRWVMTSDAWHNMLTAKWDAYLQRQYSKIVKFEINRRPEIWQWAEDEVKRQREEAERIQREGEEQWKRAVGNPSNTCLFGCCGDRGF